MSSFLDKAFSSHAVIKDKLRKAVLGQEDVEASTLRRDDVCAVGQWIYGQGGARHGGNELFEQLKKTHAAFHQEAYNALSLARNGDRDKALVEIEHGAFHNRSAEIGHCFSKMKKDPAFL
jgi:methyl-accepting chemotaxis protein